MRNECNSLHIQPQQTNFVLHLHFTTKGSFGRIHQLHVLLIPCLTLLFNLDITNVYTLFGITLCITNTWETMVVLMQDFNACISMGKDTIAPQNLFHIITFVFGKFIFVNKFFFEKHAIHIIFNILNQTLHKK